jgi:hypothetical protein
MIELPFSGHSEFRVQNEKNVTVNLLDMEKSEKYQGSQMSTGKILKFIA